MVGLGQNNLVSLTWDTNTEPNLRGYKIHYGVAAGSYTTVVDVFNPNPTAAVITGLEDGKKY